jgi:hypothetical protein
MVEMYPLTFFNVFGVITELSQGDIFVYLNIIAVLFFNLGEYPPPELYFVISVPCRAGLTIPPYPIDRCHFAYLSNLCRIIWFL